MKPNEVYEGYGERTKNKLTNVHVPYILVVTEL